MLRILQFKLKFWSKLILKKYQPRIVAITGSVGKTSTKEAVFAVLSDKFRVRRNIKNYNNEIGLPLTLIGCETGGSNIFKWTRILLKAAKLVFFTDKDFPEVLVLEMGMDRPGDIAYLTSFIKPDVSVVTAIGQIPVHVEFFAGPEDVAKEKSRLVSALSEKGIAVLNFDDLTVLEMKEKAKGKYLTFGFGEGSDVKAVNYTLRQTVGGSPFDKAQGKPEGVAFKIANQGSTIPVRLQNTFGKPQVYSALAAACVGLAFKMDMVEISTALLKFKTPPGRTNIIRALRTAG
jgi:UDP-N-acetylmuramoyl-tripeptide--D-alanyl-D-alanine ligase